MKTILGSIAIYAILGGIVATLNRLLIYANDPQKVARKEDGSIHWRWCFFANTIKILVAMCSSIFVGVVILPHATFIDEYSKFAIAGMSAIVGEQIWNIIGKKIKNIVEQWGDSGSSSSNESDSKRKRGGGR